MSDFDTKMVDNLSAIETEEIPEMKGTDQYNVSGADAEQTETRKCKLIDGKLEPCEDLMEVIDNEESIRVSELADGREYICFDNTGLIISTCPFCATTLFEEGDL